MFRLGVAVSEAGVIPFRLPLAVSITSCIRESYVRVVVHVSFVRVCGDVSNGEGYTKSVVNVAERVRATGSVWRDHANGHGYTQAEENAKNFRRGSENGTPTPEKKSAFGFGPANAKWGDNPHTPTISIK